MQKKFKHTNFKLLVYYALKGLLEAHHLAYRNQHTPGQVLVQAHSRYRVRNSDPKISSQWHLNKCCISV